MKVKVTEATFGRQMMVNRHKAVSPTQRKLLESEVRDEKVAQVGS
jgi:hypothetical protein